MGETNHLEKKLKVWSKDEKIEKIVYPEEYYCVRCYEEGKLTQANAFYPNIDLDITPLPYCRKCILKTQIENMESNEKF